VFPPGCRVHGSNAALNGQQTFRNGAAERKNFNLPDRDNERSLMREMQGCRAPRTHQNV
jgi:hypothetical protein